MLGALAACGGDAPAVDDAIATEDATPVVEPVEVQTTNYALAYFAERIGGNVVEVGNPVPAGVDPTEWSPDANAVQTLQQAELVLLNGAEFEPWVAITSLPGDRVVDTSAGIADDIIEIEDAISHSHGDEDEHTHSVTAAYTWVDLGLAQRQAEAIRDALIAARPEGETAFREGYDALATDLAALDDALRQAVADAGSPALLASTWNLAYLGDAYGIDLQPIEFGHGDTHDFIHEVEHEVGHSRVMLWHVEPPAEVTSQLEAMEVHSVIFDPAAVRPAQGDFLSVMNANIERIRSLAGEG